MFDEEAQYLIRDRYSPSYGDRSNEERRSWGSRSALDIRRVRVARVTARCFAASGCGNTTPTRE